MSETHSITFEHFDLTVEVSDEGTVEIWLVATTRGAGSIRMEWDTLCEVIDFAAVHGLGMKKPNIVEYRDTREAIEA